MSKPKMFFLICLLGMFSLGPAITGVHQSLGQTSGNEAEELYISGEWASSRNRRAGVIYELEMGESWIPKTRVASNLISPLDGACGPKGYIYFADYGGDKVIRIDPNGGKAKEIAGINQPAALTFDSYGDLYINSANGVWKIKMANGNPIGEPTKIIPKFSSGVSVIHGYYRLSRNIGGIAFLTKGQFAGSIVVVDTPGSAVLRFDPPDFSRQSYFVTSNSPQEKGGLTTPVGIAVDSKGNVFVADAQRRKILKYDPEGNFITTLPVTLYIPLHLEFDGLDNLYVTQWGLYIGEGRVTTILPKSNNVKFISSLTDAWGLAVCPRPKITPPKVSPIALFSYQPSSPTDLDGIRFIDQSRDPDGKVVSWQWDFGDGNTSTRQNPTHQYRGDGVYTVKLTVNDNQGEVDSITKEIPVKNVTPQASFKFSPSKPKVGERITFDATLSKDPDGTIVEYQWDFDDGSTEKRRITHHSFSSSGEYRVKLTVIDDDKATDSETHIVSVGNEPPTAQFSYKPVDPTDLDKVKFIDESSDPDGEVLSWHWDFGDGTTSTEQNPSHRYRDNGIYTVSLTVTDNEAATSDPYTEKITVANVLPKASFGFSPPEPTTRDVVNFTDQSEDPDGKITSWKWDFGDGKTSIEQNPTHKYKTEGEYMVKLTVKDDDGATGSPYEEKIKVVSPPPPTSIEIEDRWAIVIGISDYQYASEETCDGFCDLKYAVKDALAFYHMLIDENIGNFPQDHVTLLLDQKGVDRAKKEQIAPEQKLRLATAQNIKSAFGRLITRAEEDDQVIVYYSGHGAQGRDIAGDQEEDGRDEYYIAYDTQHTDLFGTAIVDDDFGNWMKRIASHYVIVFIDSCFSGGATKQIKNMSAYGLKDVTNNSVFNDFSFEERTLLAASQENESSFESDELQHGVFTYYLLEALEGPGDLNQDGKIKAEEIYKYVEPKVKDYVTKHWPNFSQTILMKGPAKEIFPPSKQQPPQVGVITGVKKKDEAVLGDKVLISLGKKQGIKIGDVFEVYHRYQSKKVVIEEKRGRIKVIELVGEERALCEVVESIVPIQVGDRIRQIKE